MSNLIYALMFGIVIGTILGFARIFYEDYQLKKEIKDQDTKMFKMYHPRNGYVKVLKTEKEMIDGMLKMGWDFVEDKGNK